MLNPKNKICHMLEIDYPIIQGGMVWVSGAKLAAACSNAGILGVIGAGSMKPDLLEQHLIKAKKLTNKPLAVNVPLLYKDALKQIEMALKYDIKIFILSAGSPKKFTTYLKEKNCIVGHVTSSPVLAKKCEAAGVDFVVCEGFEAGGHNGRDELTTMTLIPQVKKCVSIPVVAAGGIGTGETLLAALCLGADGAQMGTRFLLSEESSAHQNFQNELMNASGNATELCMKKLVPVRLLKNPFYESVKDLEMKNANSEELKELLGKNRAKKGMLEGDVINGELEVGQICGLLDDVQPVSNIVQDIIAQYNQALLNRSSL
jgi:enoyl-[acyl-carrier protein] reductase II